MFKVLDGGKEPTKGSKYSAAIDLYAREDVVIGAGETVKVPLGVCIDLETLKLNWISKSGIIFEPANARNTLIEFGFNKLLKSHYLQLEPRSSLREKGLIAGTGIIDLDYKDEIMIILHKPFNLVGFNIDGNDGIHLPSGAIPFYKIKKGKKIAQILLKEHKTYLMGIDTEEERNGGFGSTGK